jgi:hypothetical protein
MDFFNTYSGSGEKQGPDPSVMQIGARCDVSSLHNLRLDLLYSICFRVELKRGTKTTLSRQVLASLRMPCIAQLLGSSTTSRYLSIAGVPPSAGGSHFDGTSSRRDRRTSICAVDHRLFQMLSWLPDWHSAAKNSYSPRLSGRLGSLYGNSMYGCAKYLPLTI